MASPHARADPLFRLPRRVCTQALGAVGAIDPATHFPTWYQDKNGLQLENCLQGPPNCLASLSDITPGTAGATGESFYFDATSSMNLPGDGKAGLVLATEAAFAGGDPVAGQEITFNRIRFFATAGLVPGTTYKVTHPYGVDTYEAITGGSVRRTTGTEDIGCLAPPCGDFSQLLSSRIGPFLKWDPAVAPAGYIGDAATEHPVVGSPFGTNVFRLEGPNVNPNPQTDACPTLPASAKDVNLNPDYSPANCIETKLFVVQGKIASAAPTAGVPAAPTGLAATPGNAQVNLSWTASSGATSYNVERATTAGGPYTTVSTAGAVTGTSFTDTTVTSGTPYFYVVTAVNSAGEPQLEPGQRHAHGAGHRLGGRQRQPRHVEV